MKIQNVQLRAVSLFLVLLLAFFFVPTFLSASAEKKGNGPENRESSMMEADSKVKKGVGNREKKGEKKSQAKKKVVRKAGTTAVVGLAASKAASTVKNKGGKGEE